MVVITSLGYLGSCFLKKKIQYYYIDKSILVVQLIISAYQIRSYVKINIIVSMRILFDLNIIGIYII